MKFLTLIFLCVLPAFAQKTLLDFSAGNNGNQIDAVTLSNSIHGSPCTIEIVNSPAGMTYDSFGQRPLNGYADLSGYGIFDGAGGCGLRGDLSQSCHYVRAYPCITNSSASVGCWFFTDLTETPGVNFDVLTLFSNWAGDFVNADLEACGLDNRLTFVMENNSLIEPGVVIKPNKWYWLTLAYHINGSNWLGVFDETGTNQIGMVAAPLISTNLPALVYFGNSSDCIASFPTNHIWEDSILFDFSANPQWPLLPGSTGLQVIDCQQVYAGSLSNKSAESQ